MNDTENTLTFIKSQLTHKKKTWNRKLPLKVKLFYEVKYYFGDKWKKTVNQWGENGELILNKWKEIK